MMFKSQNKLKDDKNFTSITTTITTFNEFSLSFILFMMIKTIKSDHAVKKIIV